MINFSRDVDDLLTSGTQVEKLVVLHPAIVPVEAQLVYVAYNGWIYSGRSVSLPSEQPTAFSNKYFK